MPNPQTPDPISADGIRAHLDAKNRYLRIETRPCVSSTNALLLSRAAAGEEAGAVLVASRQTAGRGRRGRSFVSGDMGLYMSVLLRPVLSPAETIRITTAAAVAVAEAIEAETKREAKIKWVNDVLLDGRKACGILTEAAFDARGMVSYAVLGVGINVYTPKDGFPEEIREIACGVCQDCVPNLRNRLAAAFLNAFFRMYADLADESILCAYRERSAVIGRRVRVLRGEESRDALALDVDDSYRLVVAYGDGSREALSSGEISVRLPSSSLF